MNRLTPPQRHRLHYLLMALPKVGARIGALQDRLGRMDEAGLPEDALPSIDAALQEAWGWLQDAEYLVQEALAPGWMKAAGLEPKAVPPAAEVEPLERPVASTDIGGCTVQILKKGGHKQCWVFRVINGIEYGAFLSELLRERVLIGDHGIPREVPLRFIIRMNIWALENGYYAPPRK